MASFAGTTFLAPGYSRRCTITRLSLGINMLAIKNIYKVSFCVLLALLTVEQATAQTFQWPVTQPHTVSQDYGAFYQLTQPAYAYHKYHTGIDLTTNNLEVVAVSAGIVFAIK